MKTIVKATAAVLLCVALAAGLSGCAGGGNAAVVNGTPITKDEVEKSISAELVQYGATMDDLDLLTGSAEESLVYKNSVIDRMVEQELMLDYAKENGLDAISDEERQEIQDNVTGYLDSQKETIRAEVEEEAAVDPMMNVDVETAKRYKQYLKDNDVSEEVLTETYERSIILNAVYAQVMDEFVMSDEMLKEYYDAEVAEQKELSETEGVLFADYAYSLQSNGEEMLYIPDSAVHEDARYVTHVLIALPEDIKEQISQAQANGDAAAADALRKEGMAQIKATADEVSQKAAAGEDFDTLIETYGEDPGMASNPGGYFVYAGAMYDEAFLNAALDLEKPGDVTAEPVESSFGYHIIKFVSEPALGAKPFEEVKDSLSNYAEQSKRAEYWKSTVEKWKENADVQVYYYE